MEPRQIIVVIMALMGLFSPLISLLFMYSKAFFHGRKILTENITYGAVVELIRFLDILINDTAYLDPYSSRHPNISKVEKALDYFARTSTKFSFYSIFPKREENISKFKEA